MRSYHYHSVYLLLCRLINTFFFIDSLSASLVTLLSHYAFCLLTSSLISYLPYFVQFKLPIAQMTRLASILQTSDTLDCFFLLPGTILL
ncbi:hypothetical protein EDC96DRAFT_535562 [Choanephora cucurbitarum]|nr:hypothetical protein EDC96DRAFT_535562 [Choanephora cucurbitarum]